VLNPRLAGRYAKSLLDLAVEQDSLQTTLEDVQTFASACKMSSEFCSVLRSPVIPGDKKQAVMDALLGSRLRPLSTAFFTLLIKKGREGVLPEIAQAFIEQYNVQQGIKTVKLTTAAPATDTFREAVRAKLAAAMPGKQIEMTTKVDERLIGGFLLEVDNTLVDASIRRDLMDIRKQFLGNLYVKNIR
jgi:F-type H+-transporting ATPase subunit delta